MPVAVLMGLTALIGKLKRHEVTTSTKDLVWLQMETLLVEMTDIVAEAEAIAGTPVPASYSRHTSRLLSLWTLSMPFVMVTCIPPYAVPVVTVFVSWMLLATEEIGHIIEEPFGLHSDRPIMLPLDRYCNVLSIDVTGMARTRESFLDYADSFTPDQDTPLYEGFNDPPPECPEECITPEGGRGDDDIFY